MRFPKGTAFGSFSVGARKPWRVTAEYSIVELVDTAFMEVKGDGDKPCLFWAATPYKALEVLLM